MEFINSLPFTLIDVAVVALIVASTFLAFYRGFITEMLAIAGWVGAAIVALLLAAPASVYTTPYMPRQIPNELIPWVTGGIVFLIALAVFSVVLWAIARLARGHKPGAVDRALGLLFGTARGLALLAVLWLVASAVVSPDNMPQIIKDSKTRPLVQSTADFIRRSILPLVRTEGVEELEETRDDRNTSPWSGDLIAGTPYNDAVLSAGNNVPRSVA